MPVLHCIIIDFLDSRFPGIFVNYGSQRPIVKILKKIRHGDPKINEYIRANCTPRQCAAALMTFLKALHKPLLPNRVQELLIGLENWIIYYFILFLNIIFLADNDYVAARVIAMDALGLLKQDVKQYQIDLILALLNLMKILATTGSLRPTEVHTSFAPFLIMPIFFKPAVSRTRNWIESFS